MSARQLIASLQLAPHPEGGWYRELYRSATPVDTPRGKRSALTQIYYLLEPGQFSRWHVIDSDEIWHFYAGGTLELLAYDPLTAKFERSLLGNPLAGHGSVAVIPAGHWQAARVIDGFALAGCSVAPGFEFSEFRFVSALPDHAAHFSGELAPLATLL
ncbi:MAG: cupin domain-containing protein [Burkholderiaceae bacterium]|nr:cupin domain-containing protein [Burkholderiaceae bacterium]